MKKCQSLQKIEIYILIAELFSITHKFRDCIGFFEVLCKHLTKIVCYNEELKPVTYVELA